MACCLYKSVLLLVLSVTIENLNYDSTKYLGLRDKDQKGT